MTGFQWYISPFSFMYFSNISDDSAMFVVVVPHLLIVDCSNDFITRFFLVKVWSSDVYNLSLGLILVRVYTHQN